MEEQATLLESLVKKIEDYVQTNIEIAKLQAIDKLATFVSHLFAKIIIFVIVLMVFVMINIGVALCIGECMNMSYIGFFIVACFYILLALILHFFRKPLIKDPILNSIIKNLNDD